MSSSATLPEGRTGSGARVPFGKRAVELGFATPSQIVEALRVQAERAGKGRHQNLGEILVEQRVMTAQQVRDILAEEFYAIMSCPACGERFNVPRDQKGPVSCPTDGSPLTATANGGEIGVVATLRPFETPVGLELGGCRIVELLGKGSMGEVYKAKQLGLNRYVAVKLLPTNSKDPTFVRRLLVEARAIARLEHPNIVQVYDVGSEKGYFYMVLQLLHGQTLEDRLNELGPPDLRDSLLLVRDVAEGLVAAHGAGVVHRDLKPGNIFVTEDGRARLTDFGLARLGGAKDELGEFIVGTPAYMAPEQWQRATLDGRADLYSLGVVLYTLVTGRAPFEGGGFHDMMKQHLHEKPKPPRSLNPNISPGLQAVLGKMLAKSPDRRYPTVQAFVDDLNLVLQDKDPKALEETGRFVRCGFCETVNPPRAEKCKVCGERIGAAATEPIELALREGEVRCAKCGTINRRRAHRCSGCRSAL